jgi:hypothetical protein
MHSSTSRVFYRCIIIYIAITGVISSPVSWAAKSSFQFEQSEYLVTEGERVSLSIVRGVSDTAEKLYYQTQDGTASHGADYQRIRKARLDFLEGETSKTIAVDTLQDTEPEEDENFTVVILPVGGVERVETNVIIEDDDTTPLGGEFNLEFLNYNVDEGGQAGCLTNLLLHRYSTNHNEVEKPHNALRILTPLNSAVCNLYKNGRVRDQAVAIARIV